MKHILVFILGLVTSVSGYFGYQNFTQEDTLGAFGDPFLSVQLATSPSNGDCLTTDGTNNAWGSCASGSSKWTDAGAYIYPTGGGYASAPYFVATSTSVASTFVYASSTSLTVANLFGTYTVDVSSNTNLSADGTEIVLTGDALSLGNTLSFSYASTTGISGTNLNFTNATSSLSFFSALGTFTNAFINTLLTAVSATFTNSTTTNLYATNISAPDDIFSFSIASTTNKFATGTVSYLPSRPYDYTVTDIDCYVVGGTSKIVSIFGENITCDTDGASDDGSIAITNVSAGSTTVKYTASTTVGIVDDVFINVFGRKKYK